MRNVARISRHIWKLGALAGVLVLASCNLFGSLLGVSIDQRIANFNTQLSSGDYADLYLNFSSTQTKQYAQMDATYWDSTPFAAADGPGQITLTNTSDPTNVPGFYSNKYVTGFSVVMSFTQSGNDWYIMTMSVQPPPGAPAGTPSVDIKRLF